MKIKTKNSDFLKLHYKFCQEMEPYFDYIPFMLSVAPQFIPELASAVPSFLEKKGRVVSENDRKKVFELGQDEARDLSNLVDICISFTDAHKKLPRLMLLGLVATMDLALTRLYRLVVEKHPEAVFGSDDIRVSEVLSSGSMDKLRSHLIDEEIDNVGRKSLKEQIKWLQKSVNDQKIVEKIGIFDEVIEIVERRNLIAHNSSIVNDQYINSVSNVSAKIGDILDVGPKYLIKSIRKVDEFFVFLNQIVWRKLCKSNPQELEAADTVLNGHSYKVLEEGRYKHAIDILSFAISLKDHATERARRMMVVNLASAYRLEGAVQKSEETLSCEDWSAANLHFQISVAAVRGHVEIVASKISEIGTKGGMSLEDYRSWPVFYAVRDDPIFQDAIRKTFGVEFIGRPKRRSRVHSLAHTLQEVFALPDAVDNTVERKAGDNREDASSTAESELTTGSEGNTSR